MCSTPEVRLAMLRAAIDEVAHAVRTGSPGHAGPEDLAERLAGLWRMIAELDPALAARLRAYGPDTRLRGYPGRAPSPPRIIVRGHANVSRSRPKATAPGTVRDTPAAPERPSEQPAHAGPANSSLIDVPRLHLPLTEWSLRKLRAVQNIGVHNS
jgi:hypothetical protein